MGVASMGVASMEVASSGSLINGNPLMAGLSGSHEPLKIAIIVK